MLFIPVSVIRSHVHCSAFGSNYLALHKPRGTSSRLKEQSACLPQPLTTQCLVCQTLCVTPKLTPGHCTTRINCFPQCVYLSLAPPSRSLIEHKGNCLCSRLLCPQSSVHIVRGTHDRTLPNLPTTNAVKNLKLSCITPSGFGFVAYTWHSKPAAGRRQCIYSSQELQRSPKNLCCHRAYSLCCPPRNPPGCGCPNPVPGGGRRIVPPTTCRPGPIPPNPCVPVFPHGHDSWKRPKYIFFFLCIPLIIIQAFRAFSHEPHEKEECRDYEYMRRRTKRFPWGEGQKSLFHNDHVNHLPGECVPPPLDCD